MARHDTLLLLGALGVVALAACVAGACSLDSTGLLPPGGASTATSSNGGGGATSSASIGGMAGAGGSVVGPGGNGGAGGGITSPCELVNSCVLWLRADLGVTTNGSSVLEWEDQSGQGNTAAQPVPANQPTFVSGGLAGQDAVDFDRAQKSWMSIPTLTTSTGDHTVVSVLDQRNPGTAIQLLFSTYDTIDFGFAPVTDIGNVGGVEGISWLQTQAAVAGPQFLTWVWGDTMDALACYRSTSLLGTDTYSTTASFGLGTTLGSYRSAPQHNLDALVAEVIVFDEALSVVQLDDVWQYVQQRYGL